MKHPPHQPSRSSLLSSFHLDFCHFWELVEWKKTSDWRFCWSAHSHKRDPQLLTRLLQARPCWSCCHSWDALGDFWDLPRAAGSADGGEESWFNHSWQLSPTEPHTVNPPWWDGGKNRKCKIEKSCVDWDKDRLIGKAKLCTWAKQNKELIQAFPWAGGCSDIPRKAGLHPM